MQHKVELTTDVLLKTINRAFQKVPNDKIIDLCRLYEKMMMVEHVGRKVARQNRHAAKSSFQGACI